MPKRIQRKRTKGWRMPPNTVYVGRPTKYGNTFTGKKAVKEYASFLLLNPEITEMWINELRGKDLACWCPLDKPCHADVLLEIANHPNDWEKIIVDKF